ncbi:metal ABC transporter permease [Criblamydia sequanensis]|uniref:ABC-type transporter, permease subunit n=1 Tax=Candidatus Criblamydia sequanensis CRIB-18 TaxID=1437425 RepID=A0A090CZY8_9BACT|nr:metal ABC transporter permease [Criblamydia sequanensis]CDR34742.1 ABC-type transporter, permease subunit [Criblamydia sequanensis CRIB-18]
MFIFDYFLDPVLMPPTIGSMLMCLSSGIVGVFVFLKKESLIGETLSHAAYPGIIMGIILSGLLSSYEGGEGPLFVFLSILGGVIASFLGIFSIRILESVFKVKQDAALCFVLSLFFGIGILLASYVQFAFSEMYQKAQSFLYGQAATMTFSHLKIYVVLTLALLVIFTLLFKEIEVLCFDSAYARSLGLKVGALDAFFSFLIAVAICIGVRTVGVVLMSAMLIAPAATARQFTHRLSTLFLLAAFFSMASGFLGNVFSNEASIYLSNLYPNERLSLPTGPTIVLVSSFFCILALFFAPERGLFVRFFRRLSFRYKCLLENILKSLWRAKPTHPASFNKIASYQNNSNLTIAFALFQLKRSGWIDKNKEGYSLTKEGEAWAKRIVRLHRLWEVYLADYLNVSVEKVHRNAEEMEHIITPELERELTRLLKDPEKDPHEQPIPKEELF